MKFEQLLHIYWSKNFLYGGRTFPFSTSLDEFFLNLSGLAKRSKNIFKKRFELIFTKEESLLFLKLHNDKKKIINMYLAQVISINNSIFELIRYNVIRLYLIKSFRGRCHALGKPSRGQRTWSNAWNAYKCNKIIRTFITNVKKTIKKKKKKKKNYKLLERKTRKISILTKKVKPVVIKPSLWF